MKVLTIRNFGLAIRQCPNRAFPYGVKALLGAEPSRSCVRHIQIAISGHNYIDYEAERKSFSLQVPEYFNFTRDFIDQWALAEKNGHRSSSSPAFWWVDADSNKELKLSFQQLSTISRRVANLLTAGCGLQRREKVIIILPKVPEWWYLHLGCIRADIHPSAGTILLKAGDINYRIKLSQAKCIITVPEMVDEVEKAAQGVEDLKSKIVVGDRKETRPGWLNFNDLLEKASDQFETANTLAKDPMMLFFTSGTTGLPKMTEHSHSSYGLGHLLTARYMLQVNSDSVMWNWSDTGWAKCAWSNFFAPWIHGASVFIHSSMKFDPKEVLRTLVKYPITHTCCPPTAMRMMLPEKLKEVKFKALKHTICAGEPVNPELIEAWRRDTGLDMHEGYGQSETTFVAGRPTCIPYRDGSMGKASPGIDVEIVDEEGNIVDRGQEGNIAIKVKPHRPVGLFNQYVGDPNRTAASFVGDYFLMGDRGIKDEDDYIFFVGRNDDVILASGYRIGPFEVESALLKHPSVLESAVVSSPDEVRGEVVKAFVVLTPEFEQHEKTKLITELQEHVRDITAPYKYPRKIEFVKDLPNTVSGKIRRVELKQKEWSPSK